MDNMDNIVRECSIRKLDRLPKTLKTRIKWLTSVIALHLFCLAEFAFSMELSPEEVKTLTSPPSTPRPYILQSDEEAVRRLDLLNEGNNPLSKETLLQLKLKNDAQILTIGCGIGTLEIWMAKHICPQGRIIAIDCSQNFIETARQRAAAAQIENIEFVLMDAYDISWQEKFDFAYCRYLIEHLQRPQEIIAKTLKALKVDGTFLIEDDELSADHTEPFHQSYREALNFGKEAARKLGVDYDIGPKLPSLLKEQGATILRAQFYDMELSGPERKLFGWTLEEAREMLTSSHILDSSKLTSLITGVKEVEEQENVYKIFARVHQVYAQKGVNLSSSKP